MMHLLDFLLHRRQKRTNRISATTDTIVRTAASRLEFPNIPNRHRKEKTHSMRPNLTADC